MTAHKNDHYTPRIGTRGAVMGRAPKGFGEFEQKRSKNVAPPPPPTTTTVVYERPYLYPKQLESIFCEERISVIEASTKAGKTHGCLAWLLEEALHGQTGQAYWWVAPVSSQADIAYSRMKRGLPKGISITYEVNRKIKLICGAEIWFKSADAPDSLFGEDVYAAVIDEASRCKDDAWHAVRSTLTATKGRLRVIGNVRGSKNWAFKLARLAESGTRPEMRYSRLTAYDAVEGGVLDVQEIEDAKALLPENVFRELYLALPAGDGGNPFGLEHIPACVGPLSSEPVAFWGIDLAKSYDHTVAIGLDANCKVAKFERWQGAWKDTLRRIRMLVGNRTPALIDSTGVGDPIVEMLQSDPNGGGNYLGMRFTAGVKQQLMEGLAVAIQNGHVQFPPGPIVEELVSYEYEYRNRTVYYSAPRRANDDCVCALALAVSIYQAPGGEEERAVVYDDVGFSISPF